MNSVAVAGSVKALAVMNVVDGMSVAVADSATVVPTAVTTVVSVAVAGSVNEAAAVAMTDGVSAALAVSVRLATAINMGANKASVAVTGSVTETVLTFPAD
jgi:hypothetical protein